ncbi:MAG TPA: ABC transporter ATP-binding protein [Candidatus Binatia bacterium]|jgi:ATP-binding cassette subfamily B protein/subfamily B ATP-binding cassette protein MsbA
MIRIVRSYLRPYLLSFVFALAQVVVISALELLKPWPLKVVIDHVLIGTPVPWKFAQSLSPQTILWLACLGLVLVYMLLGGLQVFNNYITIKIGQKMVNDLRRDLYSQIQRLSLSFHHRRQVGDLLYRLTSDTYAIQTLTMNGLFPVLCSLTLFLGMLLVMIRMDPLLTALSLTVCPVLAVLVTLSPLRGWLIDSATHMHEQKSSIYSLVQWAIPAIRVIQAFTKEEEEHRRFMALSQQSLRADLRFYLLENLYSGAISVVIAIGTALVIWVGARHVLSGILTVGGLIVFAAYLTTLYGAIDSISQAYGSIQGAKVSLHRVFEIMEEESDFKDGHRLFPAGGAKGEVAWSGVSFRYIPSQPVLRRVDLRVHAGQKVAIVGRTGAGKSTLVSLLPRFYDPSSGRVTIDGVDVREFQLKSLRRQIAMVLQPPLVFPLTIRENLMYGRPDASEEEVVKAARLARIHETIVSLHEGYDTIVGEQGATLSEGEKQRLTIARAILINAPILILDEPTSSVDAETEALIIEGLKELTAGRTTFIIAHRLSTVRQADLIVVVSGGRIIEQGTFDTLMRGQSAFAKLYRTQFSIQEQPAHALG